MNTFRRETTLDYCIEWFKFLIEFGGNPLQHNSNGLDSYDIAYERFKKEGLGDKFNDFVREIEEKLRII